MKLRVIKMIIIVLGAMITIILLYLLIFQKPISINADSVTQVRITLGEYSENTKEGIYYQLELTDLDKIDNLLKEMNHIRARKIWGETESMEDWNVRIMIDCGDGCIRILRTGLISMNEGCDIYKMTNKKGNEFYQYIKNMCTSDEKCQTSFF